MPSIQRLTRHQKQQMAAYRNARRLGAMLAGEIARARVALIRTIPDTTDYSTLQRWAEQVKPVGEHLRRRIPAMLRDGLTTLAKRYHLRTARMLTAMSERKQEGLYDLINYANLIIDAMSVAQLEQMVLPAVARLTSLINPDTLASAVFYAISQGGTTKEIADELRDSFGVMQTDAKRISRTFGLHVATEAQLEATESAGDMILGYQIQAVDNGHSPTSRIDHKERHGRKYYRNPRPGQYSMAEMPRPPIDPDGTIAHNCRCFLIPLIKGDDEIS